MNCFIAIFLLLVCLDSTISSATKETCDTWASSGECEKNPNYMQAHCKESCSSKEESESSKKINSFFELSALDINGRLVNFSQFRGKVTIIVNVASFCGYTESHYRGLVELHQRLKSLQVEILTFPCNQFGAQEPGSRVEIKEFAKSKGAEFTMMNKIDVNGPNVHPVYRFLKKEAGPRLINWNFATYFVIGPEGDIQSFSNYEPMDLHQLTLDLMKEEL